jgi:hypothetical protein
MFFPVGDGRDLCSNGGGVYQGFYGGGAMKKFSEMCGPVRKHTLAERLLYCAGMLHLSGFMTDGERLKIHARMMKQKVKEAAEGSGKGTR